MESRLALDTHIIVWLYTTDTTKLSTRAKELLKSAQLFYSPMVSMELTLLYELDRVAEPPSKVFESLSRTICISPINIDFETVVASSQSLNWTRDPFDRLIVATSAATGIPLLTKDKNILTNFDLAVW